MIAMIAEALGKPALIQSLPEQSGDLGQTFADVSLAARDLGYFPGTPFREWILAIRRVVSVPGEP